MGGEEGGEDAVEEKEGEILTLEEQQAAAEKKKKRNQKKRARAKKKKAAAKALVWEKAATLSCGRESRLVSKGNLAKGELLWGTNEYYLSVLYTSHCGTHCGACYAEMGASKRWSCPVCKSFSLCEKCDKAEVKQWHEHECGLFCGVPVGMRQGDTDYLRFVCRFFAICCHGAPPASLPGSRLLSPTPELDEVFKLRGRGKSRTDIRFLDCLSTNEELQSEDFRSWCSNFAQLFERHVKFPAGYTVSDLADLLMRIRTNGLGFPCSDKHGTLGWSLDLYASFLDHSCSPNCEVTMDDGGKLLVRTLTDIQDGSPLLISYVDVESRTPKERRDHLFELYRFRCSCERCESGK